MPLATEDIVRTVVNVWDQMLGCRAEALTASDGTNRPCLAGSVPIRGDWEGHVAVHCPEPLCRKIAAFVFGQSPQEIGPEEIRDVLGELTNIIGGNLKGLLPGTCRLGLPAETSKCCCGTDRTWPHDRVAFRCQGSVFHVVTRVTRMAG